MKINRDLCHYCGGCVSVCPVLAIELEEILIDIDENVCKYISKKYKGISYVVGDATDPHVLEEAGISNANVLIAATGDGKVNIVSAMLAKTYGVEREIVRVNNDIRLAIIG